MRIQFIPDHEVPPIVRGRAASKNKSNRARIDQNFATGLAANPGRWAAYPLKDWYPNSDFRKAGEFRRIARSTRARISRRGGPYTPPEGKRFATRTDESRSRLLVALVDK